MESITGQRLLGNGRLQRLTASELAQHPLIVNHLQDTLYKTNSTMLPVIGRHAVAPARAEIVPDAEAIAADPTLEYDGLNQRINETYGAMARRFQGILDPSFTDTGRTSVPPTWFLFAAYSSKTVGKAELLCGAGLDLQNRFNHTTSALHHKILSHVPLPKALLKPGTHLLDGALLGVLSVSAAVRNRRYLPALNLKALLEPREAIIAAGRIIRAADGSEADDTGDVLRYSMNTLRNTLYQANRAIFTDIGVAGYQYLKWRDSQSEVTPGQVLDHFGYGSSNPVQARVLYAWALKECQTAAPTELQSLPNVENFDTASLIPAAFALFERAGSEAAGPYKNRLIECANNMLLFREQFHIVQPVYTPGHIMDNELDRNQVFKAVTPAIKLNLGDSAWKLSKYAREKNGDGGLHPAVSEYNWAAFEERWHPILDSLQDGYTHPEAMWPAPNPDPRLKD